MYDALSHLLYPWGCILGSVALFLLLLWVPQLLPPIWSAILLLLLFSLFFDVSERGGAKRELLTEISLFSSPSLKWFAALSQMILRPTHVHNLPQIAWLGGTQTHVTSMLVEMSAVAVGLYLGLLQVQVQLKLSPNLFKH